MADLKNIVVRADGSQAIGHGHVYRAIALAEIFSKSVNITFVSTEDSVQKLLPNNFEFTLLDAEDDLSFMLSNFDPKNFAVILDGYAFDHTYQSRLKDAGYSLVYLDDQLAFEMQADVVINPSLGIQVSDYKHTNTRFGLGPRFAPLRHEFLNHTSSRQTNQNIQRLLLCYGGTDYFNLTEKTLNALHEIENIKEVTVIGSQLSNEDSDKYSFSLTIKNGLSAEEMKSEFSNADACITSASTISYEVASVGRPLMVGWYADNQKNLYAGLIENNLAKGLGNIKDLNEEQIVSGLSELLQESFSNLVDQQKRMFDGLNQTRLKGLVLPLLSKLNCRGVNSSDLELLYRWANDPDVRKNSLSPDPISMEAHTDWFNSKLADGTSRIFILSEGDTPVGQIRFDLKANHFEIDYSVDVNFRGKGFGSAIVAIGVDRILRSGITERIQAKVKSENKASMAVFSGLGFIELDFDESNSLHIFELDPQL